MFRTRVIRVQELSALLEMQADSAAMCGSGAGVTIEEMISGGRVRAAW